MGTKTDLAVAIAGIGTVAGIFCVAIGLVVLKLWLVGSLITSTVKTVSHDCGQTYPVERVVSGNWFCPSVKR
jgi:hypothetical protein